MEKIFRKFEGDMKNLLQSNEKHAYIVGAGISLEAPTNIPHAGKITNGLLEYFAPEEEKEHLRRDMPRYEAFIDAITTGIDPHYHFLDYFENIKEPNLLHYFIATGIINEDLVITPNFDYMIEYALMKLLPKNQHKNIFPVITSFDYTMLAKNPENLISKGKYPIFKIHGSMKDIINGKSTFHTVITTTTQFGKLTESGMPELDMDKRNAFKKILKNKTMIILGYSGTDSFDIGPAIAENEKIEKIIWINHSFDDSVNIYEMKEGFTEIDLIGANKLHRTMGEIKLKSNTKIYLVNANTKKFVEQYLWPVLYPNSPIVQPETSVKPPIDFLDWLKSKEYIPLTNVKKYLFALNLYFFSQDLEGFERMVQKTIEAAKLENENEIYNYALFYRGVYLEIMRKANEANDIYFNRFNELVNDPSRASFNYAVGLQGICLWNSDIKKALDYFEKIEILKNTGKKLKPSDYTIDSILLYSMLLKNAKKYDEIIKYLSPFLKKNMICILGSLFIKGLFHEFLADVFLIKDNPKDAAKQYELALIIFKAYENHRLYLRVAEKLVDIISKDPKQESFLKEIIGEVLIICSNYKYGKSIVPFMEKIKKISTIFKSADLNNACDDVITKISQSDSMLSKDAIDIDDQFLTMKMKYGLLYWVNVMRGDAMQILETPKNIFKR